MESNSLCEIQGLNEASDMCVISFGNQKMKVGKKYFIVCVGTEYLGAVVCPGVSCTPADCIKALA